MSRYLGMGAFAVALLATVWGLRLAQPARSAAPAPVKESPFHTLLKQTAGEYLAYGRVDDELRWAPWLCRAPQPGIAHISASKDTATHGRKLYSLFAKNRQAYFALQLHKTTPVGQVIVKQSWIPEEVPFGKIATLAGEVVVTPPRGPKTAWYAGDHFHPFAAGKDGKHYKASRQADLFIMAKLDPKTPGTDRGWVYGTVTPDGKTVTAAGRVESCMKCHQAAKHDRLFGHGR